MLGFRIHHKISLFSTFLGSFICVLWGDSDSYTHWPSDLELLQWVSCSYWRDLLRKRKECPFPQCFITQGTFSSVGINSTILVNRLLKIYHLMPSGSCSWSSTAPFMRGLGSIDFLGLPAPGLSFTRLPDPICFRLLQVLFYASNNTAGDVLLLSDDALFERTRTRHWTAFVLLLRHLSSLLPTVLYGWLCQPRLFSGGLRTKYFPVSPDGWRN